MGVKARLAAAASIAVGCCMLAWAAFSRAAIPRHVDACAFDFPLAEATLAALPVHPSEPVECLTTDSLNVHIHFAAASAGSPLGLADLQGVQQRVTDAVRWMLPLASTAVTSDTALDTRLVAEELTQLMWRADDNGAEGGQHVFVVDAQHLHPAALALKPALDDGLLGSTGTYPERVLLPPAAFAGDAHAGSAAGDATVDAAARAGFARQVVVAVYWPDDALQPLYALNPAPRRVGGGNDSECMPPALLRPGLAALPMDAANHAGNTTARLPVSLHRGLLLGSDSALLFAPPAADADGAAIADAVAALAEALVLRRHPADLCRSNTPVDGGASNNGNEAVGGVANLTSAAVAVDGSAASASGGSAAPAPSVRAAHSRRGCSSDAPAQLAAAAARLAHSSVLLREFCDAVVSTPRRAVPQHVGDLLAATTETLAQAVAAVVEVAKAGPQRAVPGAQLLQSASVVARAVTRLQQHPDVRFDHYMPLAHLAAIYMPPWAPILLPLLIALVQAVSGLCRKRGGKLVDVAAAGGNEAGVPQPTQPAVVAVPAASPRRSPRALQEVTAKYRQTAAGAASGSAADAAWPYEAAYLLRRSRAAAPASPAAGASAPQTAAALPPPPFEFEAWFRGVEEADAEQLMRMYVWGQLYHGAAAVKRVCAGGPLGPVASSRTPSKLLRPDVAARIHGKWLVNVLPADMANPHKHYIAEQKPEGPSRMWVATISVEAFRILAAINACTACTPDRQVVVPPTAQATVEGAAGTDAAAAATSAAGDVAAVGSCGCPLPTVCLNDFHALATRHPFFTPYPDYAAAGAPVDFVPDAHGRVAVACLAAIPHPDAAGTGATHGGAEAELTRMCVHPVLHRCGIGSALIAHLERWCGVTRVGTDAAGAASGSAAAGGGAGIGGGGGYASVYLTTLASMTSATELYTGNGYRYVGLPVDGVGGGADGKLMDYEGDVLWLVQLRKDLPAASTTVQQEPPPVAG